MPFVLLAGALLAQATQIDLDLRPPSVGVPPKIDGVVNATEWSAAARGALRFHEQTGAENPNDAQFWVMYDSKALYFAGKAKVDPSKLNRDEFRQNVSLQQSDRFILAFDPKGGTNMSQFGFGAGGGSEIRLAGGRAAKTEWLGEMEVNSRVTSDGWETEARIPWEILDMPGAGSHDMKFNAGWTDMKNAVAYLYKFEPNGLATWPHLRGVTTEEVKRKQVAKLLPYAYAGVQDDKEKIVNFGLDLKAPVGRNLELVGTVNPDFRNIENDILSLDFSYFARLAGDSRPFFQEGSQYRKVGFFQRLFASQRVRDIDFGVNLYGSPDPSSQIGLLSTVDFGKQQTVVGSYTRQPNPKDAWTVTYVGDYEPGVNSHTTDLSYSAQRGNWNYYAGLRTTHDTVTKSGLQTDFSVNYNYKGLNAGISETSISADYAPRIGFTPENNIKQVDLFLNWNRTFGKGAVANSGTNAVATTADRVTGGFKRNQAGVYQEFRFRNNVELGAWIGRNNFDGSADQEFNAHVSYPATDANRRMTVSMDRSRFGGEDFKRFGINFQAKPLKRMQASLSGEWVDFMGAQTQVIGSLRYDRGRYESYGLRLIRRDNNLNWSASYRLSGRRGVEYFVAVGDPNSTSFQHQVVLKVVAPLEIRF